jgi:prophage regulatory protein
MVNNVHSTNEKKTEILPLSDRLLRWPEVEAICGICRSHAHQLAAKDLFPKPRKLVPGGRASAWVESEIREWVQQRISEADNSGPEAA